MPTQEEFDRLLMLRGPRLMPPVDGGLVQSYARPMMAYVPMARRWGPVVVWRPCHREHCRGSIGAEGRCHLCARETA